jgi:hypothetical protein
MMWSACHANSLPIFGDKGSQFLLSFLEWTKHDATSQLSGMIHEESGHGQD